jgi:hypothetical protein
MKSKTYTKIPMVYFAGMISKADKASWTEAARSLGISQSQFLREALREKVSRTVRRQKQSVAMSFNRPQVTPTA